MVPATVAPTSVERGYGGSFGQTGEEGRGGQGYGWQRDFRIGSFPAWGRGFGYGGGDRGRTGYGDREGSERGFIDRATDEVSAWLGDREAERRREQDYRGRGPKGYKRSDPRIQEDVNDRLADDPYLDASDVEVTVSAAEVTLSGSVDSRQARRRAEDLAEQVSGVSYVQNNIRVRQRWRWHHVRRRLGDRREQDCLTTHCPCFNASAPRRPCAGAPRPCRAIYCVPTGFQLLSVKAKYWLAILSYVPSALICSSARLRLVTSSG